MRSVARSIAGTLGLEDALVNARRRSRLARRIVTNTDRRLVSTYLTKHVVKKLHVGCGQNLLPGWLNSDYSPDSRSILRLDATKRFPFAAETFDYVFSEHMIEHISHRDGLHMLCECFRVLVPGGKIRVSTPDLQFLLDLYRDRTSQLRRDYVCWATEQFIADAPSATPAFVINNFVRAWGHVFIYDEPTLRRSLQDSGFRGVVRCALNSSSDPELANLENERRMPEGFLRLESMTFEATKPASTS